VPQPAHARSTVVDRLLDTAAGLFWEKGYAATTTREIASALGIQQASLYFHMSSKEDLLYQVFRSSLRQFLAEVPWAVQGISSPLERIRVLIHAHVNTLLSHQKRNVTMITELRALSPHHRAEVLELRAEYANFVTTALRDAQTAGVIRSNIPATHLCLALLNMLNWAALWFRKDKELSTDAVAEIFVQVYLNGARADASRGLPAIPSKSSKPRKRLKASESATVDRLLDAAAALFARQGYTVTTTREVAALLGMQKASLYHHIESKEDLLFLICRSSLERIRTDVETAIEGFPDPLDGTHALICAHVESLLRDADEHSTTLAEMHALSPHRLSHVAALREGYVDLVRSVLHEGQHSGALRSDIDAKYLSLCLLGLMYRVLVWYHRRGPLSPAQLGQLLAVIFLTGTAA
jgi:AcrR family transcriptional regulator